MKPALQQALLKLEQQDQDFKPDPSLLLHPNIPKPLHTVNPRTILGQVWWDVERKKAYNKFGYRCWACGHRGDRNKANYLEAHENYDINYTTGRVALKEIVALCKKCHLFIHSGFVEIMVEKGEMSRQTQREIREHGSRILMQAGLASSRTELQEICRWSDWYLELQGKKHYSPFSSYEDWCDHWRSKGGKGVKGNTYRQPLRMIWNNWEDDDDDEDDGHNQDF